MVFVGLAEITLVYGVSVSLFIELAFA